MDTSILYAKFNLDTNKALHDFREACRDSELRKQEIVLAFMESTIDEVERNILFEDANNAERKQGIIATIFQAIIDLFKSVMDAIASIFTKSKSEEKCKDIIKVGEETKLEVKGPDIKKHQKAAEKYEKRMNEILSSNKDAAWIESEAKKAAEEYENAMKSNFDPKKAIAIGAGVLGAGLLGGCIWMKATGKTPKSIMEEHKNRRYVGSMVSANTKGMNDEEKRDKIKEMEKAEAARVSALRTAASTMCKNLERTSSLYNSAIERTVSQINECDYQIARTTGTGNVIKWFQNKWYKGKKVAHELHQEHLISRKEHKENKFATNPEVQKTVSELKKHTGMLDEFKRRADKADEKVRKDEEKHKK